MDSRSPGGVEGAGCALSTLLSGSFGHLLFSLSPLLLPTFSPYCVCCAMAVTTADNRGVPNDLRTIVRSPVALPCSGILWPPRAHRNEGSGVTFVVWLQPLRRHKPDAAYRLIGYQSAVALSSPIVQITAYEPMPISNINIGLTLYYLTLRGRPNFVYVFVFGR